LDLALIDQYDALIVDLERTILREAKRHVADAFHWLRSVPGIGNVLSLTILYEIHDITRFDRVQAFASYARLVTCKNESGGKKLGTRGATMGHVQLKWAFSEAAVLCLRHTTHGQTRLAGIEKKHGKGRRARFWPTRSDARCLTCCREARCSRCWFPVWLTLQMSRAPSASIGATAPFACYAAP